jgi:hypothetical protein
VLVNVVGAFLDGLPSERAFDAAFVAMLRAHGFYDVHCTHGPYEFGKDFIAKLDEAKGTVQYAFQTKAGDVGSAEWNVLRDQLEEIQLNQVSHPSFDRDLPLRCVGVLTGELKGKARVGAQEYIESSEKRKLAPTEIWTRGTLVDLLNADCCLGEACDWTSLGGFIDQAAEGDQTLIDVERLSERWCNGETAGDFWRAALEACLLRDELGRRGLRLHAARVVLGLVRAWCLATDSGSLVGDDAREMESLLRSACVATGDEIVEWFAGVTPEERTASLLGSSTGEFAEFSPRLSSLLELVGLAVFAAPDRSDEEDRRSRDFFDACLAIPASHKPLSDEFAVSVLTTALAAHRVGLNVGPWLEKVTVWVGDQHGDEGLGLGEARGGREDALWRTVALPVNHEGVSRRRESTVAAAVLDACSLLGLKSTYEDASHDFAAVEAIPYRNVPVEYPVELKVGVGGIATATAGEYSETWLGEEGWRNATLHARTDWPRPFDEEGHHWVGVALGLLLRDRWWLHSLRRCIGSS